MAVDGLTVLRLQLRHPNSMVRGRNRGSTPGCGNAGLRHYESICPTAPDHDLNRL